MNHLSTSARDLLRAVLIGCALALVFSAAIILALQTDFAQEKIASLRYRVAEIFPAPTPPQFAPTPLALPTAAPTNYPTAQPTNRPTDSPTRAPTRPRTPTFAPDVIPIQPSVSLRGFKHEYQKWNNCGPATLAMTLSFFGRTDTQAAIAAAIKPNYDDRNVRPDELSAYASSVGLRALVRVNGSLDRLKLLLSNDVPVIIETALVKQPQGWMGHYRLLIGYDAKQFFTLDSYDGPSVKLAAAELDDAWRAFNRQYLVIYDEAHAARVRAILADTLDDAAMYAQAAATARAESAADPQDAFAAFNLGASLVGLNRYAEAATAFDRARTLGLPWRMMWYEFGAYEAYLHVGRNAEVIALADTLLRQANDLEESHYYKGLALRALKREPEARAEFETALRFNPHYRAAQRALANDK